MVKKSIFLVWWLNISKYLIREEGKQQDEPSFYFSIGLDIETGGHVFQIHLTNSLPMYEVGFLTQTHQSWTDGGIHFGFNISREFTLKWKK